METSGLLSLVRLRLLASPHLVLEVFRMSEKRKEKWIQGAIKRPGSLTEWFKRNRSKLKKKLGFDPITKSGDINDRAITKTIKLAKEGKIKVSKTTLKRLYLARTLQKMRRRK